jgi:hypothetical protein
VICDFSWISSAEATKFADTAKAVVAAVKRAGPAERLIKKKAEAA